MKMIIKNVLIYTENKKFVHGEIFVRNGKFFKIHGINENSSGASLTEDDCTDAAIVDGTDCFAIPGLIDLHIHGCAGYDFSDADPEALRCMAEYEASVGVTSFCPATMTVSEDCLHKIMNTVSFYKNKTGAKLTGIRLEGPFINEKKKGAQSFEHIRLCDIGLFRRLSEESGNMIKIIDVAPETSGAMEFIESVSEHTLVSIGHTDADYDTASQAIKKGATHVTHLYNAMPEFCHRDPGVIGAARDNENCHAELICDGIHVHPSAVRAAFAMFGAERIILVSDSMRAAGLKDGQYKLGGQDVYVNGSIAALKDGTIAGSVTNLTKCLKTAVVDMGIPLEDAVMCATINPAKEIGIYDTRGSITAGKDADFILLDKNLNVKAVYINGIKNLDVLSDA